MLQYFIQSFRRKLARRRFREYPYEVARFEMAGVGNVEFARWQNPLIAFKSDLRAEIAFFQKYVAPGSLVIDIGANIGNLTVAAAVAAGKTGLALAFDPNPHAYRILKVNAALNPALTNIRPYNVAVTRCEAEFDYRSSEASFCNGGISSDGSVAHGRFALCHKVRGVVLDELLQREYADWLPKLSLVKIDTEGYDNEVIKSIYRILKSHRPLVITECFKRADASQRQEQFSLLTELGYSLHQLADFDAQGKMIRISTAADMNRCKHFDLIAIPPTKLQTAAA